MGDGDDGEIRLFAQIEPQSQGTMCREVSNKDVRQRTVVIFLSAASSPAAPAAYSTRPSTPSTSTLAEEGSSAECSACGSGFSSSVRMKPRSIRTGAVMIEDHESATPRDIVG